MVTHHLKKEIIKEGYIKRIKRKRVANATPTNSIAFFKTPTNYIEPIFTEFFYKYLYDGLSSIVHKIVTLD